MKSLVSVGVLALAVGVSAGASPLAAPGAGGRAEPSSPSLTVYSGNLALVRQRVERPLGQGSHTIRVDGLPTNMDPSSLVVLSAGVTLLGTHGLRSYQDAASGPGASLDLDLEVNAPVDGLSLAFLTNGLSWSADYAVIVARNDTRARVDGYASIVNGSGAGYEDAEVQLLAGTIQPGRGGRIDMYDFRAVGAMSEAVAAPELQQAAFGDYHLYTVSQPLSLGSGESRRIRLVGAGSVVTEKQYTFRNSLVYHQQAADPLTRPVAVSYKIVRPETSDFGGTPLPSGQVRMFQEDEAGRVQLLGIASIPNTPKGEDLWLNTGYAFDILGTRTQTRYERPSGNRYESNWKVELRNRSESKVTVQVVEELTGDWQIVESTHRAEKLSAGAVRFRVDVEAGGEATLEYHVVVRT